MILPTELHSDYSDVETGRTAAAAAVVSADVAVASAVEMRARRGRERRCWGGGD